tara:strand:+ start:3620 stop:4270 length:651 start_codon:yes stop_codon:yes gene_type:complete
VIKLYQLEKRIINKFLYLFGKSNTFVIYSPQRSFSNFFRQLVEMNLFINYEQGKTNLNYYKHNPKVSLDNNLKKNFIIFILYKEFNLWYQSIKKNPADFFLMLNKFNIPSMTIKNKIKLKKYHKDFYDFWILNARKTKNIEFINFREVLNDNNNQFLLNYFKKKYDLTSNFTFKIPKAVRFSKKINKKKILNFPITKDAQFKKINKLIKQRRKLLI